MAKRDQNGRKRVFKGDGSRDTLFSRSCETFKVFWTTHFSGYLMEPIRDNDDFKEAVRNVKNGQKQPKTAKSMIFKVDSSLGAFFSRLWERLDVFCTPHIEGNQSEPIRTSKH